MGYWKFLVPEATTNLLSDPSFELPDPDTEWSITGDGVAPDFTRATTRQFYGFSCALADLDVGGGGTWATIYQSVTVTATSYTLSARVRRLANGVPTSSHTRAQFDNAPADWDSITDIGNNWYLCVKTGTATAGARTFGVYCAEDDLYVDAVQLEQKAYRTTFCDGEQEGCWWNGPKWASTSSRSAASRAGGRVYDFEDDYSFSIIDWQGWGVPPHRLDLSPYKVLPGGALSGVKVESNVLTLVGYFKGSTLANLHSLRQALVEELAHDRYPATDQGWQPVRIRYTGAAVPKEARCFYDSGLEGSSMVGRGYTEQMPVRFLMADPFWYEVGESASPLDVNDTATLRYLGARLKSTGQWNAMGLSLDPANANGESGDVYTVCRASDGSVYFAGQFEGLDADGVGGGADAGCDYIARYDPEDEMFRVLVGAGDMPVGSYVHCISEGPDGTIYIGGEFAAVNGDGTLDYIVAYDPDTDTWSDLDDPDSGGNMDTVLDMAWDSDGNLWVVGEFAGVAGVANTEFVAYWDGSSWHSAGDVNTGSAAITSVAAIAIDSQDNVYVGGNFTSFADDANADYWAWYNGSSWAAVDDIALSSVVYTLEINEQDELFVGGAFTDADSVTNADYIFKWTGYAVEALDVGTGGTVRNIAIAPNGTLWVVGAFTTAGSISAVDRIAIWNGSSWAPPDVNLTGTPIVRDIDFGPADPAVPNNYDVYIGYDDSGAAYFAGDYTITNAGTAAQYPVFYFRRSGGTSARLVSIKNWTTGHELFCDYSLLDEEELTIDCRPLFKSVTSSFFGNRPVAILPNSDFGAFHLQLGPNLITAFFDLSGAITVYAYMSWKDTYRGID